MDYLMSAYVLGCTLCAIQAIEKPDSRGPFYAVLICVMIWPVLFVMTIVDMAAVFLARNEL